MAAAAQETEAVVEPCRDRSGAQRAEPRGGELERERQAVEAEADAGDVVGVLVVEHEARRRGGRALDEERHRLVVREALRRLRALRIGDVERGDAKHDLARRAQRLSARREDRQLRRRAEQRVREAGGRREQVLAVVEHEQQRPPGEEVDHRVHRLLLGERTHVERGRDRIRDEPRIRDRRELHERGAGLVRRLDAACELERQPRLADAAGRRRA